MIKVRIRKAFPPRPDSAAFSLDVELETASGVTVLFGPSGSGKTLTLDSIAGFARPDDGRILLDDQILYDGESGVHLPPQARRCGYVFQNYALFPHMTLRRNLEFAAERRPRLERHRKVNEMLEHFHLAEVAGRRPHELSGGQKQRCSIARALIGAPRLLLLDEPARGLDAPLRTELYELLSQIRTEFQIPVLLVTHDLDECFEVGDQMIVLRDGRIVQNGPPKAVAERPASPEVARLLGIFNLVPVEIVELDPQRNSSRLKFGEYDLLGPYFPGRLRGDRVSLCIHPAILSAGPREGKPAPNQVPARLLRAVELPGRVRLEFSGDLRVELSRPEYDRQKHNKEWVVIFPQQALRII
ncbi:MAG TPA: ATP-binding cassette domain-containing protein [Bryobacteraceae bacterium]|nr:ATP-binding cassette domain-containing protein [Bryobacteraceae bacterium]